MTSKYEIKEASWGVDGKTKWFVPSRSNPYSYGFGTTIHDTLEDAKSMVKSNIRDDEYAIQSEADKSRQAVQSAIKKEQYEDTRGFADQFTGIKRDRIIKVLKTPMRLDDVIDTRFGHIIRLLKNGYTIQKKRSGLAFVSPSGSYFTVRNLTKIAFDFAQYMIDKGLAGTTNRAEKPPKPAQSKQPWEMTREEFDEYWVSKTKEGIAKEVEANTKGLKQEIIRLNQEIEQNPNNPGRKGIEAELTRLQSEIAAQNKRLSSPIGKPSSFMTDAQSRWHRGIDKALAEGKPVPPEVLADYPELQSRVPNVQGVSEPSVMATADVSPVKSKKKQSTTQPSFTEVMAIHESCSPRSREADERMEHSLIVDPDDPRVKQWIKDPGRMDVRGVDTPRKHKSKRKVTRRSSDAPTKMKGVRR